MNTKDDPPRLDRLLRIIFVSIIAVFLLIFSFSLGYSIAEKRVLEEAVEVGAGEYIDNYQTMRQEFQWITIDERRK